MIAILADRDLAFVIDANRFDYPHQTIGNRPIDLWQEPTAKLLFRIRLDGSGRAGSKTLGLAQQFRLILFPGEGPVQTQTFDFLDEGRLEVQGVANEQIQETASPVADQILQPGELCACMFLVPQIERSIDAKGDAQHYRFCAEVEPVISLVAVQNANELEDPVFVGSLVDAHELAPLVRGSRPEIDPA